ncbi:DUF3861 domain-containing protein [Pseudomonas amygdali]|uniref:DUF3861 domain-containing protein n=1 Tax=Pseudomonas amygdali TaxID=47877 RepID=UPI001FB74043|nr:DUF3861 domain-containing protein [Pseudomonas amygdali]UPT36787.1 DUF3861 domain-containing protein [Pseudomonas amygdali pv. loropetali]
MKLHRYQVTVQEVPGPQGGQPADAQAIRFEVGSHDDLHDIVGRAKALGAFDDEAATAFAVGLKLFGGVMLEHRDHPLFAEFAPHFGQFMRSLKGKNKGDGSRPESRPEGFAGRS